MPILFTYFVLPVFILEGFLGCLATANGYSTPTLSNEIQRSDDFLYGCTEESVIHLGVQLTLWVYLSTCKIGNRWLNKYMSHFSPTSLPWQSVPRYNDSLVLLWTYITCLNFWTVFSWVFVVSYQYFYFMFVSVSVSYFSSLVGITWQQIMFASSCFLELRSLYAEICLEHSMFIRITWRIL